jgi:small subunit ribosomal protein S1
VLDNGIEVDLPGGVTGFIRRSDLARDRADQRPERFATGDKIDGRITSLDRSSRKVSVSIKALEIHEEKEAMAQYGSSDSGASLGDILGAAIKDQADQAANGDEPAPSAEEDAGAPGTDDEPTPEEPAEAAPEDDGGAPAAGDAKDKDAG